MKKLISSIFLLLTILILASTYLTIKNENINSLHNIEKNIASEFVIPNFTSSNEKLYSIIENVSKETNSNVFRSFITYSKEDKAEFKKYILLNKETNFFNNINIIKSKEFNISDFTNKDVFISSAKTENVNQLGLIKLFGTSNLIEIRGLENSFDYHASTGIFYVETSNYEDFLKKLVIEINKEYNTEFNYKDFTINIDSKDFADNININPNISLLILICILIIISYYIISNSKKMGILKLNGYSKYKLWYFTIGRFILLNLIISLCICLITFIFIKNINILFIYKVLLTLLSSYLFILFISFSVILLFNNRSINNMLKNKKNNSTVFLFSLIFRIIISIIIINNLFLNIKEISINYKEFKTLNNWDISKDYAVFPFVKTGNDISGFGAFIPINASLYPYLNDMGSILINTPDDGEYVVLKDSNKLSSTIINPNYLNTFPILDLNNKKIEISESETDYVILLPEKYKKYEDELKIYFTKMRKASIDATEEYFDTIVDDIIKNQNIKIIFIKNNQKLFSFNSNAIDEDDNFIKDHILEVITINNSVFTDRDCVLGTGINDPLKIKLINRNKEQTFKILHEDLKKIELDDNLTTLISINDAIIEKLYNAKKELYTTLIIVSILLIIYLMLSMQNIKLLIDKNLQKITVSRLFGIKFTTAYKTILLFIILTWITQFFAIIFFMKIFNIQLFMIIIAMFLIELIYVITNIFILEKTNKIKILKNGV